MIIKQKRVGKNLIEIDKYDWHDKSYYCVSWREDAGNWMPWEVREDGTRHIMSLIKTNIEDAEALFDIYIRMARENG